MKVMVDGYNIALSRGTGVATYGRVFLKAAHALGHETHLLFGEEDDGSKNMLTRRAGRVLDFATAPFGFKAHRVDVSDFSQSRDIACPPTDAIWNRPRLFRAAKRAFRQTGTFVPVHVPGVDIAHWTYPLPLFVPGAKNIYTIHDIVPLKFPWMIKNGVEEYRRICNGISQRADHILTVSNCSREDIIAEFNISGEKVTNTYQAFDLDGLAECSGIPEGDFIGRQGLPDKGYFLFFGAIEPKKNVGRLLDAFEGSGVKTPLVVVAAGGWSCEAEQKRLAELAQMPGGRVRLLQYLSRRDLVELIRHAKATIFPSLYEGFGLPVLESMALGTAVIVSHTSALPEVAGEAGWLVDPHSVESIRQAICAVDTEDAKRVQLERKGLEQALLFSNEAYHQRLAEVFGSLFSQSR
ncbi:glycosyltransferase family 4 protein [Sphingobium amiense]|uniref:glycosyltransferase family 4 protein n=1 Tax=Sphingobium amiense TaxID=135719 RepID=UPI000A04E027|nr:glycosyltransferase family 1 protein [Sphingobium amiense]